MVVREIVIGNRIYLELVPDALAREVDDEADGEERTVRVVDLVPDAY